MTDKPVAFDPPKVETCANRFELMVHWGQPFDPVWAHMMLAQWLANRNASVYDSAEETKGRENANS